MHVARCLDDRTVAGQGLERSSVAGALEALAASGVGAGETVVCVLTASGLRWPAAFAGIPGEPERVPIDVPSEGGSSRPA